MGIAVLFPLICKAILGDFPNASLFCLLNQHVNNGLEDSMEFQYIHNFFSPSCSNAMYINVLKGQCDSAKARKFLLYQKKSKKEKYKVVYTVFYNYMVVKCVYRKMTRK